MVSIIDRHFPNGPRSGFDRDGKNGARQVDEMATTPPAADKETVDVAHQLA
jgi:hypothetical protein